MLGCSFLHRVEYLHIRTVLHIQKSAQLGNMATTQLTCTAGNVVSCFSTFSSRTAASNFCHWKGGT